MTEPEAIERRSFRFLLPTLLICCGGLAMLRGFDAGDLRTWLNQAGHWAPIAFVLGGVASMSVLVPKTVVSVTAGALFGTGVGSLLMLVTAVIAAALNYSIGRWWLQESIERRLKDASDHGHALWIRAIRDVAGEAGFRFHFLMRLTPVPTTVISYAMGASGSRVRPFLAAAAAGVIPQLLWVHGGTAVTLVDDPSTSWQRWSGVIVSVIAAIAIGILVPRLAFQRIDEMKQSRAGNPAQ